MKLYNIIEYIIGGVAEWLKATVLKTVDEKLSESSNLSSSKQIKYNFYIKKIFLY